MVSWENSFGERFTEERSLSFSALAEENLDVWGSGSYVEPADPDEPAPSEAGYILELLPWWVYAAVALIYLLIVVYIGFSVRAHRRKVLEDDEDD